MCGKCENEIPLNERPPFIDEESDRMLQRMHNQQRGNANEEASREDTDKQVTKNKEEGSEAK